MVFTQQRYMWKIRGTTRSVKINRCKILCFNYSNDLHSHKTFSLLIKSFVPVFFLDCCFQVGNNLKEIEDNYCAEQYVPVRRMASALTKRDYTTLPPEYKGKLVKYDI